MTKAPKTYFFLKKKNPSNISYLFLIDFKQPVLDDKQIFYEITIGYSKKTRMKWAIDQDRGQSQGLDHDHATSTAHLTGNRL